MGVLSIMIGTVSVLGILVAFFPYLGFLHWFVVPLAVIGFFLGLTSLVQNKKRAISISGIVLCGVAFVIGTVKLSGFPDLLF